METERKERSALTKEGTVVAITPAGLAVVAVKRDSACGHSCENCGGCTHGAQLAEAEVENPAGAEIGDRVRIEMSDRQVLSFAAAAYLLPLVTMFAGYAAWCARSELWGVAGAGMGLAVGILLLFWLNRRFFRKADKSRIIEIIGD